MCVASSLAAPAISVAVWFGTVLLRMRAAIWTWCVARNTAPDSSPCPVRICFRVQSGSAQCRRSRISALLQRSPSTAISITHSAKCNGMICCPTLLLLYLFSASGCLRAHNMGLAIFFDASCADHWHPSCADHGLLVTRLTPPPRCAGSPAHSCANHGGVPHSSLPGCRSQPHSLPVRILQMR